MWDVSASAENMVNSSIEHNNIFGDGMNKQKGITRRQLIEGLIGLGATMAVPISMATASEEDVEKIWLGLLEEPWFFDVDAQGTIIEPDAPSPKTRSDVYDINLRYIETPGDLVSTVSEYEELRGHFVKLAASELEDVESDLDDEDIDPKEFKRLTKLKDALDDVDEGWIDWITLEGKTGLKRFVAEIDDWLSDDVDWQAMHYWPDGWSGQGRALQFFESLGAKTNKELGVVIVEGEHPGSSYYAAELRIDVAAANVKAESQSIPIRFRRCDQVS